MSTLQDSILEFYKEITPNNSETFGYELSNVKEFKMRNGIAWTGNLKLDGKKVAVVECHGDGGCYSYHFEKPVDRADFLDAVKEAYAGRTMLDVEEDCFINFLDFKAGK